MTRKMKNSGVEWIGDIPEDWEVTGLGRYSMLKTGTTPTTKKQEYFDGEIDWFTPSDFGTNNLLTNSNRKLSELPIKENIISLYPENSILLIGIGATVGKIGYINEKAYSNQQITAIIPKNIYYKYLLYFMLASAKYIKDNALYTTLPIINNGYLKEIPLTVPFNKEEQKAIADFLDQKTQEIDNIISKTKKAIEEYKKYKQSLITETVTKGLDENVQMKDSGIEWIGEIPEHWDVIRLKYLGWTRSGLGNKSTSDFGHGYPFITYKNIYENYELKSHYISDLVDSTDNERKLFNALEGDVFFTGSSETVEELGLSSVCMENIVDSTFNGFSIRFRPKKDVLCKGFSKFYFRSCAVREFLIRYDNSITRANLSQRLLKGMEILLLPLDEQKSIANYLDNKCSQIDQIISTKEKLLREMEAYKKSLIYETVTGKREVE